MADLSTSEMSSLSWPEVKFKLSDAKKRSLDSIALSALLLVNWHGMADGGKHFEQAAEVDETIADAASMELLKWCLIDLIKFQQ